jgi:hypothetical protein
MVSAEKDIFCFDFQFPPADGLRSERFHCDMRTDRIREPEKQRLQGNGTRNSDTTMEEVMPRLYVQ